MRAPLIRPIWKRCGSLSRSGRSAPSVGEVLNILIPARAIPSAWMAKTSWRDAVVDERIPPGSTRDKNRWVANAVVAARPDPGEAGKPAGQVSRPALCGQRFSRCQDGRGSPWASRGEPTKLQRFVADVVHAIWRERISVAFDVFIQPTPEALSGRSVLGGMPKITAAVRSKKCLYKL